MGVQVSNQFHKGRTVKPKRRLKTETIAVRVMPHFKRIVEQLALSEGLDLSAWMRNLILKELKNRGIIKESTGAGLLLEETFMERAEGKS